ncbi:MAG: hypothetical protein P0116_01735 [Candidatus Nitrosocosmicus sp.]|nr:hypothetical protein [Candidatus Nitrosocosmicus sp.]
MFEKIKIDKHAFSLLFLVISTFLLSQNYSVAISFAQTDSVLVCDFVQYCSNPVELSKMTMILQQMLQFHLRLNLKQQQRLNLKQQQRLNLKQQQRLNLKQQQRLNLKQHLIHLSFCQMLLQIFL